jgi:hypothetical protein
MQAVVCTSGCLFSTMLVRGFRGESFGSPLLLLMVDFQLFLVILLSNFIIYFLLKIITLIYLQKKVYSFIIKKSIYYLPTTPFHSQFSCTIFPSHLPPRSEEVSMRLFRDRTVRTLSCSNSPGSKSRVLVAIGRL